MKKYLIIVLSISLLSFAAPAYCQLSDDSSSDVQTNSNTLSLYSGYDTSTIDGKTLPRTIAKIIRIFLGTLGVIFIIIIISAGWNYFIAGGDTKKITDAKDRMMNATIGLLIIFSAYTLTYFVFKEASDIGVIGGTNGGNTAPTVSQPGK